ncbi:MAG TPA: hypothetical protein DHW02_07100 [Ktedonobacter sp.]|nr:hypothetical protein [Ktedonobacter sp.]
MNNDNLDNNQNAIDVYANDPGQGQERNRIAEDAQTTGRERVERIRADQRTGTERERMYKQDEVMNTQAPISSGQQSSTSTDASGNAGFSEPESGFGQPQAQGGNVQPLSGYNESSYNQPGTSSEGQGRPRMDGIMDTEGSNYDQLQGDPNIAERTASPDRSGVQPALNKPGTSVDTPGRETGDAWGMDEQMGLSTDTSDRRNPAE